MPAASIAIVSPSASRRVRLAELTSGIGALVLGIGIGALVGAWAEGLGPWLLGVGALAHGWGMYDKRRVARGSGFADPWWSAALYWACWVSLGLGASALSARLLGFF